MCCWRSFFICCPRIAEVFALEFHRIFHCDYCLACRALHNLVSSSPRDSITIEPSFKVSGHVQGSYSPQDPEETCGGLPIGARHWRTMIWSGPHVDWEVKPPASVVEYPEGSYFLMIVACRDTHGGQGHSFWLA